MATEKNPFAVLGFAPTAFHKLTNEQVRQLVRAQYRTLATIFHPDVQGGNKDRFKEIQDANDRLEEDFEFRYWKDLFLRSKKDTVADLHKKNDSLQKDAEEIENSLYGFFLAYCRREMLIRSECVDSNETGERGIWEVSLFGSKPWSLLMIDHFKASVDTDLALSEGRHFGSPASSYSFEIRVSNGTLRKRNLRKVMFDPRESGLPKVRRDWIELHRTKPDKSYYFEPKEDFKEVNGRLIGCFDKKEFNERKARVKNLIASRGPIEDDESLKYNYSLSDFGRFLRYIRPTIRTSSLAVVADIKSELVFQIFGYVRKILPIVEE